jgi:FkbM family methyltransferase
MKIRTRSPFWRRVFRFVGRHCFRLAENNDDGRMDHNGERWLLREVLKRHIARGRSQPFVVVDAGCNVGDYTRNVLLECHRLGAPAEVHAFEPSPQCLAGLRTVFATEPEVRIVAAGVADQKKTATLFSGDSGSGHASFVPREILGEGLSDLVTVPLVRLDDYLKEQGIARVDLLKLDIEGYEIPALKGLGEQLRPESIDVIQFEYGGAALDAGSTLRELYRLLEARGYVLAKLFPHSLEVRAYGPWMEHYAYANYVALPPCWLESRSAAS